jgi:hypothetical protein
MSICLFTYHRKKSFFIFLCLCLKIKNLFIVILWRDIPNYWDKNSYADDEIWVALILFLFQKSTITRLSYYAPEFDSGEDSTTRTECFSISDLIIKITAIIIL